MLLCGECGRRLTVRYKGNGGLYPMYHVSENGSPTRPISIHHPQRQLHEVLYAPYVGMPNGRMLPFAFGISTRRTGGGK